MNDPIHFKNNLRQVKEARRLTLTDLSNVLDMSRNTLQSVITDGNTSLYTACRIANALQVPLCTMVNGELKQGKAEVLQGFLSVLNWFADLTPLKKKAVRSAFGTILQIIENDRM